MAWAYGVLAVAVVAGAVTDLLTKKIPNYVTYSAAAAGLVGHALTGGLWGDGHYPLGLMGSLGGLAVGFVPLVFVWKAGGIGGGDAKMMGAVGALGGWTFALAALFCSLIVALLMALGVMFWKRITWQTLGRVWRFLLMAITPNKPADPATPNSPTIPFGVAICVGAAAAMVDRLFGGPLVARFLGM